MIRLLHLHFPGRTLLLAVTEAIVLSLLLILALFGWTGWDAQLVLGQEDGFLKVLVVSLLCLLCMHYYDLYTSPVLHHPVESALRIMQVLGTACLLLAVLWNLLPASRLALAPVLSWVTVSCLLLPAWRRLYLAAAQGPSLRRQALVLGTGPLARALRFEYDSRPELGIEIRGTVAGGAELDATLAAAGVRCVFVACTEVDSTSVERLMELKKSGYRIQDGVRAYEAITGRVALAALQPCTLLFSDDFAVPRLTLAAKRAISIAGAAFGLAASLPAALLVAVAICLDSPGPVLFWQRRVGLRGRVFELVKFRSMYCGFDADAARKAATVRDPRVTRVGRWIRRLRLDEIPGLYNVLIGDMDLVGPRPFTVEMEVDLSKQIPFYDQRWSVKPGATGWAQVRRGYCESLDDNIEKLGYDLFYIKNAGIGLDLVVIFETIKLLLLGRGGR